MKHQRDLEESKKTLKEYGYILLKKEKEGRRRLFYVQEEKTGYKFRGDFWDFLKPRLNRLAHKSNPYSVDNIKLWMKKNKKDFVLLSEEYENSDIKMKFYHPKCKEYFDSSWDAISGGDNCPVCRGYRTGDHHSLANIRPDIAKEWDYEKNIPLTPNQVTVSSGKKVFWICDEGHSYQAIIDNRTKKIARVQYVFLFVVSLRLPHI